MGTSPVFIGPAYVSRKIAIGFVVASLVSTGSRSWPSATGAAASRLRATATDQAAASSCGINVPAVFSLSWILAGMAAAGAGILVGAVGGVSPTMGVFGLSALVVVIVGGLDSIAGALVGGLIVGLIEAWAGTFSAANTSCSPPSACCSLILMIRPYGLFGTTEIERL